MNPERDNVISDLSIAGVERLLAERGYAWGDLIERREPAAETDDRPDESV